MKILISNFKQISILKIPMILSWLLLAYICGFLLIKYNILTVIVLLIAITVFGIGFFRPDLGLLLIIFSNFILAPLVSQNEFYGGYKLSFIKIFGLVVFVGWLFRIIIKSESKFFIKTTQSKILIFYLLSSFISLYFSEYKDKGFISITVLLMQSVLYFLTLSLSNSTDMIRRIIFTVIISGIIGSFIGFYQIISNPIGRLGGTQIDPNEFSIANAMYLSLTLYQFLNTKKLYFLMLLGILSAVFIFNIFSSGSRGGFLTLVLLFFVFLLSLRQANKIKPFIFVFGLILISSLILISQISVLIPKYSGRVFELSSILSIKKPSSAKDQSIQQRITQLYAAKNMFFTSPIIGHGPRTFNKLMLDYTPIEYKYIIPHLVQGQAIHNIYFSLLAERGLLGFCLFICLIWLTFRDLRIARITFLKSGDLTLLNWTKGFETGFLCLMFFGLFSATGLDDKYMMVLMALAPILRNISNQNSIDEIIPDKID